MSASNKLIFSGKIYQNNAVFKYLYQRLFSHDTSVTYENNELKRNLVPAEYISQPPSELDTVREDVSDYAPYHVPSFNIASYVNKSSTLQQLVKLGVDLHKIELTNGAPEVILRLDFERDISKYIRFLHDIGVPAHDLGSFITKNPLIFTQSLDDLAVRINYLESKKFTPENICRIVTKNPRWLSYRTQDIDGRLGFFQDKFSLMGDEVRHLTVRMPKIITYDRSHIDGTYFSAKEEMGFLTTELKQIVLNKPKVFTISRKMLVDRFSFLHNVMAIPQNQVASQPGALLCRLVKIKERHGFLASLGRAQYDPCRPGYVSLIALVSGTDADFCGNVAKTAVQTYNQYLKTL